MKENKHCGCRDGRKHRLANYSRINLYLWGGVGNKIALIAYDEEFGDGVGLDAEYCPLCGRKWDER